MIVPSFSFRQLVVRSKLRRNAHRRRWFAVLVLLKCSEKRERNAELFRDVGHFLDESFQIRSFEVALERAAS